MTNTPPVKPTNEEPLGHEPRSPGGQSSGRRRRPPAVTILAIIQGLNALAFGTLFLALLGDGPAAQEALAGAIGSAPGAIATAELVLLTAIVGAFFGAAGTSAVLLLRMRQLGWTLTMLLTGVGLASSLYTWLTQGSVLSVWLLVQVVTVIYLNQRRVRQAFGISGRSAGLGALESRG